MRLHSHDAARRATLLLAAATALIPAAAMAQATWPSKPVTIVVPFPAGGGTDAFARPLSAQLTKQLGQQVIIDNRGGAGGTVGAGVAAKAAPDGYTLVHGRACTTRSRRRSTRSSTTTWPTTSSRWR